MVDTPQEPEQFEGFYPTFNPQMDNILHQIENFVSNIETEIIQEVEQEVVVHEEVSNFEIKINEDDKTIKFQNVCLTVENVDNLDPNYGLIKVEKTSDINNEINVVMYWPEDKFEQVVSTFNSSNAIEKCEALKKKIQSTIVSIICDSTNPETNDVKYISGLMNFENHPFVCKWRSLPQRNIISSEERYAELYGHSNCNHPKSHQNTENIFYTCNPKNNLVFMGSASNIRGLNVCENFELAIQKIVEVEQNFYAEIVTTSGTKVFKIVSTNTNDIYDTQYYTSLTEIDFDISLIDPIAPARKQSNSLITEVTIG